MSDWPRPTEVQIENGVDTLIGLVRVSREINGPVDAPESTWEPTAKQRRRFRLIVDHVLRADAKYRFEREAPARMAPRVLNVYTGEWIPVAPEDQAEVYGDPDGVARRYQQRFRDEWNAAHPEGTCE